MILEHEFNKSSYLNGKFMSRAYETGGGGGRAGNRATPPPPPKKKKKKKKKKKRERERIANVSNLGDIRAFVFGLASFFFACRNT